jgi:BASS family bile acid:Na+ symporter
MLNTLANLFPLWVLAASALALFHPSLFTWFEGPFIVWGLAVIMLGMGITLSVDDFRRVLAAPRPVVLGFLAQFTIMPAMAYAAGLVFALPTPLAVGLILVGCCPGGTASNVVSYIARADVALSVLMTMCSTMAAVAMTPLLTSWLAGTMVPVDAWGLFLSTVQVVLLPVALGVLLHHWTPRVVAAVLPVAPLVSVVTIALICASVIGDSAAVIRASGVRLLLAILSFHAGGFLLGYAVSRLFGHPRIVSRTVSIEVGMQNSGLAVVLARRHFADPLTAVPGAISSVVHSLAGSLLAALWRARAP